MLKSNPGTRDAQLLRLNTKTQDEQLKVEVVNGTGLSPWEAEVLVDTVKDVYHSIPGKGPLLAGQMVWTCVSSDAPHGKPLKACEKKTIVLTVHDSDDHAQPLLDPQLSYAANARMRKICRLSEEALEQGGILTQEDLAKVLCTDVRTIRRDIARLRDQHEIMVKTRGVIHDIGPSLTHKGKAIELWLDGYEPVEVARRIKHSLKAVERYLQQFSRCVFLRRKGFTPLQIAMTIGISSKSTEDYLAIYKTRKNLDLRLAEIDSIGAQHFDAEDEKKSIHSSATNLNVGRK